MAAQFTKLACPAHAPQNTAVYNTKENKSKMYSKILLLLIEYDTECFLLVIKFLTEQCIPDRVSLVATRGLLLRSTFAGPERGCRGHSPHREGRPCGRRPCRGSRQVASLRPET